MRAERREERRSVPVAGIRVVVVDLEFSLLLSGFPKSFELLLLQ